MTSLGSDRVKLSKIHFKSDLWEIRYSLVKAPAQKQLALLRVVDEALGLLRLQGGLARGKNNNEGERFWGLIVKLLGNIKVFSKFMENI